MTQSEIEDDIVKLLGDYEIWSGIDILFTLPKAWPGVSISDCLANLCNRGLVTSVRGGYQRSLLGEIAAVDTSGP